MNSNKFDFINKDVLNLAKSPFGVAEGEVNGNHYKLSFAIPNYRTQLTNYFSEHIIAGLDTVCRAASTTFNFTHFGVSSDRTGSDFFSSARRIFCNSSPIPHRITLTMQRPIKVRTSITRLLGL